MTTWSRICRICSCSADYDIFAKIPTYLHSNTNEFLNWQKPINLLIEEATGLRVSKEDGLPENICALCISYLKHAVNFREQTINNALNLKSILMAKSNLIENIETGDDEEQGAANENDDKANVLVTAEDLARVPDRETDVTKLFNNYNQPEHNKVKKQLLNNNLADQCPKSHGANQVKADADPQTSCQAKFAFNSKCFKKSENRLTQGNISDGVKDITKLKVFTEEDFNTTTTSGEDSEDTNNMQGKHNFFNYEERNFEEDDIIDLDELRGAVTINIPETCKERKCRACFRRFMFEDTYNEHLNSCIELKFLIFIEEMNRLLEIRRSKSVSPHEFIRRMIFALRKISDWLKQNYVDDIISDILTNGTDSNLKKNVETEAQNVKEEEPEKELSLNSKQIKLESEIEEPNNLNVKFLLKEEESLNLMNDSINEQIDILNNSLNSTFETIKCRPSNNATPINMSNNILYEIERSECRQVLLLHKQQFQKQMSPLNILHSDNLLQKPIPILPSRSSSITSPSFLLDSAATKEHLENNNLLIKLQKAEEKAKKTNIPKEPGITPLLSVRKDLQDTESISESKQSTELNFTARCNPCDLTFDTLATLELHNAIHHNKESKEASIPKQTNTTVELEEDERVRNRIIALFEDSSVDED